MKSANQDTATNSAGDATTLDHGPAGQGEQASPAVYLSSDAAAVAQLYSQLMTAAVVNLLLVAFVVVALWGYASTILLLAWAGLLTATILARISLHRHYQRAQHPEPHLWANRHLVLTAASGLLWGITAPLFVPHIPPLQELVLIIAIAGIAAGALSVNAAVLRIYLVYLAVTVTPVALTYFASGDRAGVVLGTMAILYAIALTSAGSNYSRNLQRAYDLAAQLNEANRELERRASHDALTGLWNRSRFETALDRELDRVGRYGSSCALIMLDIDRFKQINDSHGHDIGDRVLMQLGELLRSEIRNPDCVARWGGEEFMILLPETGLAAGAWAAERLRRRVADTGFDGPGGIAISLGVTVYAGEEERSQLLKRLDDALYRAKQTGRNRVESTELHASGDLF